MLQRTLKVDHLQIPEDRVILIIGKAGNGKVTLANHLVGDAGAFAVGCGVTTNECSAITRLVESNGRKYRLKVIVTPGYFPGRHQKDQLGQMKTFLEKEAPDGVNTALLVLRAEPYNTGVQLQSILKMMESDMKLDKTCFALAFTGCENFTKKEAQEEVERFLADVGVTEFITGNAGEEKRYITVGFPVTNNMTPAIKEIYEKEIANDEEKLRRFVLNSHFREKKVIGDLLHRSWWW